MTLKKDLGNVGFSKSNVNSWSETVVEMWSLVKELRAGVENCLCVLLMLHRRALRMARGTENTPMAHSWSCPLCSVNDREFQG